MRSEKLLKRLAATVMTVALACSTNVLPAVSGYETYADDALPERVGEEGCKEIPGTSSTFSRYNNSFLSVTGYASAGVHDRTEYIGTDYYRQVKTPAQLVQALYDAQKKDGKEGTVKVIEIMCDMDIGYRTAGVESAYMEGGEKALFSKDDFNSGVASVNPLLDEVGGISKIQIKNTDGLTIFSRYGATLNYTSFDIQESSNDIVIRNIKMDGSWQWDNKESGLQKEADTTYVKVNGNNVWIDHCEFTLAPDGCVDVESGAAGVTLSWCKFGIDPDEALDNASIKASILCMEKKYQEDLAEIAAGNQEEGVFKYCDINSGTRYRKMRQAGATPEEIMQYTAYHSKVHLVGSGDKDFKTNPLHRITLAYNKYESVGQRIPMIRQGTGHMFNCVVDNTKHTELQNKFSNEYKLSNSITGYTLTRCINARNGASIAADTCVFNAVNGAITGKECQGDDTANINEQWIMPFSNAYNHALIVNSKVNTTKYYTTNDESEKQKYTYTGSSWDNKGDNIFVEGGKDFWHDSDNPLTYKNWAWSSKITTVFVGSTYNGVFDFEYNTEEKLPYEYQMVPLEDVETVVNTYAGMGVYDLTPQQWLSTQYSADSNIKPAGDDKIYIAKSISFADSDPVAYVGDKVTLALNVTPSNITNPQYKWSVKANPSGKATIDENTGELTAQGEGKVKVTVKLTSVNGMTLTKSVTLTIKAASLKPQEPEIITGSGSDVDGSTGSGSDVDSSTGSGSNVDGSTGSGSDVDGSTGSGSDVDSSTGSGSDVDGSTGSGSDVDGSTGSGSDVDGSTGSGSDVDNSTKPGTDGSSDKNDEAAFKAGDADCNNKVDLNDAKLVLKLSLGINVKVTEQGKKNADYDRSGKVDLSDAKYTLKEAVGIKVVLPAK